MDTYGSPEASDDELPRSVHGEAMGGSRPSTAMHSPFVKNLPLVPGATPGSDLLRPAPQLPATLTLAASPTIDSPESESPAVIYAEAFATDDATPQLPSGRWSSVQPEGETQPPAVAADSMWPGNAAPQQSTPPPPSTPPHVSTPPRVSTPPSMQRHQRMASQFDVPTYYGDDSDDMIDVIDAYDRAPTRQVSRASMRSNASASLAASIVDEYGGLSRMSSVVSRSGTFQKRHPHATLPDTPQNMSGKRQEIMRRGTAESDDTGVMSDRYPGAYPESYTGLDSPLSSPGRRQIIRAYAPRVGDTSEANHSVVSFPDQSTDQFILPPDYQSQVFLGDHPEQLYGGDRDWDERKLATKNHFSIRGIANLSALILLVLSVLMLFLGYPLLSAYRTFTQSRARAQLLGQQPDAPIQTLNIDRLRNSLIDPDTPMEERNRTRFRDGKPMKLVFSDEFNVPGRSFYPGEDPFWQAEDLHYWQTENYEWYDPETITTQGGDLVITLSEKPERGLNFRGGLLSSWNKFCFTGGYLEVRLQLPGVNNASGLWPAVWTMGNLGRAGYGASTEGLWPYSYDSCDVGTMPNQTYLASQGGGPVAAETSGHYVDQYGPALSFLPGQRLSRCTCPNSDDHPGPRHPDGTFVGRSAPEIDVLEAAANNGENEHGQVSMSLQVAPFDDAYNISQTNGGFVNHNNSKHAAILNDYTGSSFQQAVSAKVNTTDAAYQFTGGEYDEYGFEYSPGGGPDSYITWTLSQEPAVTFNATALGPNPRTEVGQRPIPQEPMYILMNLGIASSFAWVNWDVLSTQFPAVMRVDYVRVWQEVDKINVGCSPPDFPTADYIAKHHDAYHNTQYTSWLRPRDEGGYDHPFPGNMLLGQC